jgi:hypothetical protein
MSATQVYEQEDLMSLFYLPLLRTAYAELQELQVIMLNNPLTEQSDVWTYVWGERYTSSKFYTHIHSHIQTPLFTNGFGNPVAL